MRLRTMLVPVAVLASVGLAAPAAHAGEITGNGKATQGPAHAQSICVYSGLEDGDVPIGEPGFPGPGGAAPQNWGHVKQALRDAGVPESDIAATRPGVTCNGHTGIIASGGGEG